MIKRELLNKSTVAPPTIKVAAVAVVAYLPATVAYLPLAVLAAAAAAAAAVVAYLPLAVVAAAAAAIGLLVMIAINLEIIIPIIRMTVRIIIVLMEMSRIMI